MTNAHHRQQSSFPVLLLELGFGAGNFSDSWVGAGRVPHPFHRINHEHLLCSRIVRHCERLGVGKLSIGVDGRGRPEKLVEDALNAPAVGTRFVRLLDHFPPIQGKKIDNRSAHYGENGPL